jgi:glycosyltransferase involved in cell wall biosynthesis
MTNKKIFIFTSIFSKSKNGGGPVKSLTFLVNELKNLYNIVIVTSNKDVKSNISYENIKTNTLLNDSGFRIIYNKNYFYPSFLSKLIDNESILYFNSFFDLKFTIIPMLIFKENYKVIIAPRGQLEKHAINSSNLLFKKQFFLIFFKIIFSNKKIVFHATSELEKNHITKYFPNNRIFISQNLTSPTIETTFSYLNKGSNNFKVIFISRISRKKNLHLIFEILRNFNYIIQFDVYGPIEDKEYFNYCHKIFSSFPKNISYNYKGTVDSKSVVELFKDYHVFLFPTLSENFGHVIFESLSASTPVVTSDNVPWDLDTNRAGFNIKSQNVDSYVNAIKNLYELNNTDYNQIRSNSFKFSRAIIDKDNIIKSFINEL